MAAERLGGLPYDEELKRGLVDLAMERPAGIPKPLAIGDGMLDIGKRSIFALALGVKGVQSEDIEPVGYNYNSAKIPGSASETNAMEGFGFVFLGNTLIWLTKVKNMEENEIPVIDDYIRVFDKSVDGALLSHIPVELRDQLKKVNDVKDNRRVRKLMDKDSEGMFLPFLENLNLLPKPIRVHLDSMNPEAKKSVYEAVKVYKDVAKRLKDRELSLGLTGPDIPLEDRGIEGDKTPVPDVYLRA